MLRLSLVFSFCLCACAQLVLGVDHHYRVTVDSSNQRLELTAEFNPGIFSLRARDADESGIENIARCDGRPLSLRGNRIRSAKAIECLKYHYQIGPLTNSGRVQLPSDVFAAAPSQWLLIPKLNEGDKILIQLALPPGIGVSVPWQKTRTGFSMGASPESGTGIAFFGNLQEQEVSLERSTLRVTLIPRPMSQRRKDKLITWLRTAAKDVEQVSGKFPIDFPQVVAIVDTKRWGEESGAVPFGHVVRDGGESVRFYINANHSLSDFLNDWTATHEFAHLLLPYVHFKQKWVSEGFASYYQNVLLARRGIYSEKQVWQKLRRSFSRAESIVNAPSPNNAYRQDFWDVRMLVYWSGAAMALLADTQLRDMSGGQESLDTVLARFQDCCIPAQEEWTAQVFFTQLDMLTKYPVFLKLYNQIAEHRGMPDTRTVFEQLGVITSGDKVLRFSDHSELAEVRKEIMRKRVLTPLMKIPGSHRQIIQ